MTDSRYLRDDGEAAPRPIQVGEWPSLLIAYPHNGSGHANIGLWCVEIGNKYPGDNVKVDSVQASPVHYCRNKLGRLFLEQDYEWLLSIDSDVNPPMDAARKMMETALQTGASLVCAPTPMFLNGEHLCMNLQMNGPEGTYFMTEFQREPFEIEACGFGCVLIKREALLDLKYPWWNWTESDGREMGEDIGFCRDLRKAGHSIWADGRVLCRHYKTVDLLALCQAMIRTYDPNDPAIQNEEYETAGA